MANVYLCASVHSLPQPLSSVFHVFTRILFTKQTNIFVFARNKIRIILLTLEMYMHTNENLSV